VRHSTGRGCTCALQAGLSALSLPSDPNYTKEEREALRTPSNQLWREVQKALIICSTTGACRMHMVLK